MWSRDCERDREFLISLISLRRADRLGLVRLIRKDADIAAGGTEEMSDCHE